jgi:hypothetical protein
MKRGFPGVAELSPLFREIADVAMESASALERECQRLRVMEEGKPLRFFVTPRMTVPLRPTSALRLQKQKNGPSGEGPICLGSLVV